MTINTFKIEYVKPSESSSLKDWFFYQPFYLSSVTCKEVKKAIRLFGLQIEYFDPYRNDDEYNEFLMRKGMISLKIKRFSLWFYDNESWDTEFILSFYPYLGAYFNLCRISAGFQLKLDGFSIKIS